MDGQHLQPVDGGGRMGRDALVQRLQLLGLDVRQAEAYLALLADGPAKASEVAARLGITRSASYQTLGDLVASGCAQALFGRPLRFAAEPPVNMLRRLEVSHRARFESVRRSTAELGIALAKMPRGSCARPGGAFRVIEGRREVRGVLAKVLDEASRTVRLVNTHDHAVALGDLAPLRDPEWAARRPGVSARALVQGPTLADALKAVGIPAHTLAAPDEEGALRFAVVDSTQALLWTVNDPSHRPAAADMAIWSDGKGLVQVLGTLFDAAWSGSLPVRPALSVSRLGSPPARREDALGGVG